jgi:hypothetical protein
MPAPVAPASSFVVTFLSTTHPRLQEHRRQADERDRAELMMRIDGDEVARHIASERGYDPEVCDRPYIINGWTHQPPPHQPNTYAHTFDKSTW